MKKYVITFLLSIISVNMWAQRYHMINKYENIPHEVLSNIDKMGMDDSAFLTEVEGKYLNAIAGISEKDFNLSKCKVAFFKGNGGAIRSNKKEFFAAERGCLKVRGDSITYYFGVLYIFNAAQKAESGGYDAAIVSGSKRLRSQKNVVKQLKKEHKKATRSKGTVISIEKKI